MQTCHLYHILFTLLALLSVSPGMCLPKIFELPISQHRQRLHALAMQNYKSILIEKHARTWFLVGNSSCYTYIFAHLFSYTERNGRWIPNPANGVCRQLYLPSESSTHAQGRQYHLNIFNSNRPVPLVGVGRRVGSCRREHHGSHGRGRVSSQLERSAPQRRPVSGPEKPG